MNDKEGHESLTDRQHAQRFVDTVNDAVDEEYKKRTVPVEKVLDEIGQWWAEHIHGSPIARNAPAWNHLVQAIANLKLRIEALK